MLPARDNGNGDMGFVFRVADKRKADRADHWFDAQVRKGLKEAFGVVGDLTPEGVESGGAG